MSTYQSILLMVYGVGLAVAWGQIRPMLWLSLSAGVMLITSFYWQWGWGNPAFISALIDGAVCLGIYAFGRYIWELILWRLYQTFVLIHLLFLLSTHGLMFEIDFILLAAAIETVNVLIVLTIIGTAITQRFGASGGIYFTRWRPVRSALRFVYTQRTLPPFWKV